MSIKWTNWILHDGKHVPAWYYHVEAIDMERNIFSCPANELDWSWGEIGGGEFSPGNILTYRIRIPEGLRMLKKLVSSIPEKGDVNILFKEK